MTITEAAACGTPAVATASPATPTPSCDGRSGLLVDDRDELVAALDAVLPTTRSATALSRRALEHAAALHVGGHRPRHARGARRRGRAGVDAARDARRPQPPTAADRDAPAARRTGRGRAASATRALAALAYVPLLLTAPGKVGADTKQYLYLDPGRLLERAPVDVGPEHRAGHGHPPEHRLPVPDGPVLLGARRSSACPTGSRSGSGSARILFAAGARRAVPAPHARTCAARASVVGRARVHALPVPARLRGAHLGDPAAVGRRCRGCSRS